MALLKVYLRLEEGSTYEKFEPAAELVSARGLAPHCTVLSPAPSTSPCALVHCTNMRVGSDESARCTLLTGRLAEASGAASASAASAKAVAESAAIL